MEKSLQTELKARLQAFRQEPISPMPLKTWLDRNKADLAQSLSPGILLKLRSGNTGKIMAAIAVLLPHCTQCGQIGVVKIFSSRQEHLSYARKVEDALSAGVLKIIRSPSWLVPATLQMGAANYLECAVCGAIWSLAEPERDENGRWERIA